MPEKLGAESSTSIHTSSDRTADEIVVCTPETAVDTNDFKSWKPQSISQSLNSLHIDKRASFLTYNLMPLADQIQMKGPLDLSRNHLFVWCSHCPGVLLIEYPVEQNLSFLDSDYSKTKPSAYMVTTVCRSCTRRGYYSALSSTLTLAICRVEGIMMYKNACELLG